MKELSLKAKANFIGLAVMLFLVISRLLSALCGLLAAKAAVPDWLTELIYIFITVMSLLLPWLLLTKAAKLPPQAARLGRQMPKPAQTVSVIGVFMFVTMLCTLFTAVLNNLAVFVFKYKAPEPSLLPSGAALALSFINKCVLPAFLEEIFFRGTIQASLSVHGKKFALITASLIFAAVHFTSPAALISVFVTALFLGLTAYDTQSCALPILLHFINNSFAFLQLYVQQNVDAASALFFGIITYAVFIAWGIFAFIHLKACGKKPVQIKNPPAANRRKSYFETLMTAPFFSLMTVMILVLWVSKFIWG